MHLKLVSIKKCGPGAIFTAWMAHAESDLSSELFFSYLFSRYRLGLGWRKSRLNTLPPNSSVLEISLIVAYTSALF